MLSKAQVAFKWSAERLRETTGKLYFWTFTFKDTYNAWEYARLWHSFCKDLEHVCPTQTFGIRVVQMHPGGHGFHYHCLLNQWIDSREVWRLCFKHGMGCDAQRIKQENWERSVFYLMRYLTKDAEPFPIRVGRFGAMFGFPIVPQKDIKYEHPHSDSVSYLTRFWSRGSFGPAVISQIYNSPNCTGDYRTLIVGLDYRENRRMDSFTWIERDCENALLVSPYSDWISYDDTIYEPGRMPRLLPRTPF